VSLGVIAPVTVIQANTGSSVMGWFDGAPSFNVSHQSSFNQAAAALQESDEK
jgi:hypothetical protein